MYRARAMKRSVKKGFSAVRLKKVPMGSEVSPVEGERELVKCDRRERSCVPSRGSQPLRIGILIAV